MIKTTIETIETTGLAFRHFLDKKTCLPIKISNSEVVLRADA